MGWNRFALSIECFDSLPSSIQSTRDSCLVPRIIGPFAIAAKNRFCSTFAQKMPAVTKESLVPQTDETALEPRPGRTRHPSSALGIAWDEFLEKWKPRLFQVWIF